MYSRIKSKNCILDIGYKFAWSRYFVPSGCGVAGECWVFEVKLLEAIDGAVDGHMEIKTPGPSSYSTAILS